VPRKRRRTVFGRDPASYDRFRLRYPQQVYDILRDRCGLRAGAAVFEIGPGTGIATRALVRHGAGPLTVVEADRRMVRYLARTLGPGGGTVRFLSRPFERARLPPGSFDLGVAASSFHWLPQRRALRKIARALKPGGWWATWNSHHGDPSSVNPFHRTLQPIYRELRGGRRSRLPARSMVVEERRKRLEQLRAAGAFDRIQREEIRQTVMLSPSRVTAMWATFSDVVTLPAPVRRWFLSEMDRRLREKFGSRVPLPVLTMLYTARRRPGRREGGQQARPRPAGTFPAASSASRSVRVGARTVR
jgi:SAM-dependent methyltransferase